MYGSLSQINQQYSMSLSGSDLLCVLAIIWGNPGESPVESPVKRSFAKTTSWVELPTSIDTIRGRTRRSAHLISRFNNIVILIRLIHIFA